MLFKRAARIGLLVLAATCSGLAVDISPSGLQINLGAVPIDKYFDNNSNGGGPWIKGCSDTITVQECIEDLFQDDADNWVGQGVTGVRFFFALGGMVSSTPFDTSGNLQAAWVTRFEQFMDDLASYGIETVAPVAVLTGDWSASGSYTTTSAVTTCSLTKTLEFVKWLPFGRDPTTKLPDTWCGNTSYNYAAANSVNFWGWTPYLNLVDAVLDAADDAGLVVDEWEIENEVNFGYPLTVMGRLLYDNTTSTNVVSSIRSLMSTYGFSTGAVTMSAANSNPTSASYDCPSFYGDSARLITTSQITAAFGGAVIGVPPYSAHNGLPCVTDDDDPDVRYDTSAMTSLPTSWSQPTITDIHNQTAYAGGVSDTEDSMHIFYNDVWAYLTYLYAPLAN